MWLSAIAFISKSAINGLSTLYAIWSGVSPLLFCSLIWTVEHFSKISITNCTLPVLHARWRGVSPLLSLLQRLIAFSVVRNVSTIRYWRSLQAKLKGVSPSLFCTSRSQFKLVIILAHSLFPFLQSKCKGVSPLLFLVETSKSFSTTSWICWRFWFSHAVWRGVFPFLSR